MNNITIKIEFNTIKIYIDNILHIHIERDRFLGLQSWRWNSKFVIEFTLTTNTIVTEYEDIDMWKTILDLLDKNL